MQFYVHVCSTSAGCTADCINLARSKKFMYKINSTKVPGTLARAYANKHVRIFN